MAIQINKVVQLDRFEIVKYQLMHYCFMNKVRINETELNCLSILGEVGPKKLSDFLGIVASRHILGNAASVSNCLNKLAHTKLYVKSGVNKKMIELNPELEIVVDGGILINLKLIKIETDVSKRSVQKDSRAAQPA